MDKKPILIFGVGTLQKSLINRCKAKGLLTVGIDPCADAACKDDVDIFEIVGGQDYEKTLEVAKKYNVCGVITTATDKPIVMMARIAEALKLPFFSVETAQVSTDKFLMKQRFIQAGVPCAKGVLIDKIEDFEKTGFEFPVIVKPRDNSGSRGVRLCNDADEFQKAFAEAMEFTHKTNVLVEEFIEGQEYSIEGLHYDGISEVIQFTEKTTTEIPYNVELAHKQPAHLSERQKNAIREVVSKIAKGLGFVNCPSHTELKINKKGIFVIETSPRFGGDYITSELVPLSTGINVEDQLINITIGEKVDTKTGRKEHASGVRFFCLPEGEIKRIDPKIKEVAKMPGVCSFELNLKEGDMINKITNSLNRYGEVIVEGKDYVEVSERLEKCQQMVEKSVIIRRDSADLLYGYRKSGLDTLAFYENIGRKPRFIGKEDIIPVKFRKQGTNVGGLFTFDTENPKGFHLENIDADEKIAWMDSLGNKGYCSSNFVFPGNHHGVYPVYLWPGTIAKIEGIEDIANNPKVLKVEQLKPVGTSVLDSGTFEQCFALVHFSYETTEDCGDVIRFIHKHLKVWSGIGKDLVFKMLDFNAIEMERLDANTSKVGYFKRRMMDELIYGRVSFRDQMNEAIETFLTKKQLADKQYVEKIEDDIIDCYITYKARPRDYFYFDFPNKTAEERDSYLTETLEDRTLMEITGFEKYLTDLTDKYHFYERTEQFFHRKVVLFDENTEKDEFVRTCLDMKDVFVKPRAGSEGDGTFVVTVKDEVSASKLFEKLVSAKGMWLVEERIQQSKDMVAWNTTSVNTVRLSSFYNKNGFFVLGPIFRTGRQGSYVDNTSAGGIFALIDGDTGKLVSKGYDINGNTYENHPDSKKKFSGYQIPRWNELLSIAKQLHLLFPDHIFIAWDFALTENGWDLVEGNWGRFRGAQIAAGKGLKHQFLEYMHGGSLV